MAEKTLSERPTGAYDYAYSDFTSYSRQEFIEAYPLGANSVVQIIGTLIAGALPGFGWIVSVTNALSELTSNDKQQMVNEVYEAFVRFPAYNNVLVSSKFKSLHKGSQGWFWTPANGYRLLYT
jgi:hypothetical protein